MCCSDTFAMVLLTIILDVGRYCLQVDQLVGAARGEEIGTYIKGAMDRVIKASKETLQALNSALSL